MDDRRNVVRFIESKIYKQSESVMMIKSGGVHAMLEQLMGGYGGPGFDAMVDGWVEILIQGLHSLSSLLSSNPTSILSLAAQCAHTGKQTVFSSLLTMVNQAQLFIKSWEYVFVSYLSTRIYTHTLFFRERHREGSGVTTIQEIYNREKALDVHGFLPELGTFQNWITWGGKFVTMIMGGTSLDLYFYNLF